MEIFGTRSVRVSVQGVYPLELAAVKALAQLAAASGETPVDEDNGFTFIFPKHEMALWRDDTDDLHFATVGFGTEGYCSRRLPSAS